MTSNWPFPVDIAPTRNEMGRRAAAHSGSIIRSLLEKQQNVRVIFAAAPSQSEFLQYLKLESGIEWKRIEAFHMDEYHELRDNHPELFRHFLKKHIWDDLPFGKIEAFGCGINDPKAALAECRRYAALLDEAPVDICFLGIGENGHLAFNDPPVADFNDPEIVKIVTLDEVCRVQQYHDAGFLRLQDVPRTAITITISGLMRCRNLSVVVPGPRKARAVLNSLTSEISTACPATILRKHPNVHIWLDTESASLL